MKFNLLLLLTVSTVLTACGGGSNGAPGFPLEAAYQANLPTGRATVFDITGTCSGVSNRVVSAPVAGSFENAPALVKTITASASYTNCPATDPVTSYDYYDSNFDVLGFLTPNVSYSKFLDRVVVPERVQVGDSAVLGTAITWTDSSKTRQIGTTTYSYLIESQETATSAIAKLISRNVDATGAPFSTQTETYRLTSDGTLRLLVDDTQYANGYRVTLTVR